MQVRGQGEGPQPEADGGGVRKNLEKVKKRSARSSPANRFWRRHPDLNRGVRVLQTLALPLGYGADFPLRENKKQRGNRVWSGKRDSNPRHSPWQGDALPLSYSRIFMIPRCIGGNNRARTCDPLLVRQMLSQLSYASETSLIIIPYPARNCKRFFSQITDFF